MYIHTSNSTDARNYPRGAALMNQEIKDHICCNCRGNTENTSHTVTTNRILRPQHKNKPTHPAGSHLHKRSVHNHAKDSRVLQYE